jgi:predicted alpha/beta hydrolase family esterase
MKHQLLFVQGGGKRVHDEWDSRLVESLRRELEHDYNIRYPQMPNEDTPSYSAWKTPLERGLRLLGDGAILVGHSVGGTILLKVLAEQASARRYGGIFLIAVPFVGEGGWSADDLQFPSNLGERLPKGVPIHFFHGFDDRVAPIAHMDLYAHAIPQARIHRLHGRDHQLNNDLREVAAMILTLDRRSASNKSLKPTKPAQDGR